MHFPTPSTPMTRRLWSKTLLALGVSSFARVGRGEESTVLKTEFIFESGPTPSCHATTIVETSAGLVAAWFGGTAEGKPDVTIWLSREVSGKWTSPVQVADGRQPDGSQLPCWNPVLFQPSRGPLRLFYKVGPSPQKWWGLEKTSTDGGQTWSAAVPLPPGILGPIKNKPIELANGDLLCPTSTESPERPSKWQVHFERRTAAGVWSATPPVNDGVEIGAIQPSLLSLGGSKLVAVGRTNRGRIFQTTSADEGANWSHMTLLDLPNPNSGTDAVTLRDGLHLLVFNDTPKGRSPLNVALSKDGTDWHRGIVLESAGGEYSYPAVIKAHDGLVHITYTWKRQRVRHVVIKPPESLA